MSLGPFEHGYIDAGDLAGREEMGPKHRANLLYPHSLPARTAYTDGWAMAVREERPNPRRKPKHSRRRHRAARRANPPPQLAKRHFFIVAKRGNGKPLAWNGRSFSDTQPPEFYGSQGEAAHIAAQLWVLHPKIGRLNYKLWVTDEEPVVRRAVGRNPSRRAAVDEAATKFKDFTGHEAKTVERAHLSDDKTSWELGPIRSIEYEATRDNETARWHHPFKAKSRPLLTASRDGSQLHIVGGRYEVTDAGIEDR